MNKILLLSHKEKQCGVHEYFLRVVRILMLSKEYVIKYKELETKQEYLMLLDEYLPDMVMYNYSPPTMPWLTEDLLENKKYRHVCIWHWTSLPNFDAVIIQDPTAMLKPPNYVVGRPLPEIYYSEIKSNTPTIGTFSFGVDYGLKGFEKIISLITSEFNEAVINMQLSSAFYGDRVGSYSKLIADNCRKLNVNPNIKLNITHNFLPVNDLVKFLAGNSLNIFLYDTNRSTGITGVLDYALAARRPIAITKCPMFRHMWMEEPSICIENNSLKTIMKMGMKPLEKFYDMWSDEKILAQYEQIIQEVLNA